jgi:hypothetical protein
MFKCIHELLKLHKNNSSGAIIWGSLNQTEENILLLDDIDLSNNTVVTCHDVQS